MDGEGAGRLDGLLCSCNARSRKTLVGHAQWETIYPPSREKVGRARLGIHQTYPVWPVSLVPHVPHVSRQRNYASSKGQPWPFP